MTVVDVTTDPRALTLTLTAEFDAPRERVWQVWSDPRQLERWWGPPTWPATFVEHDITPGGSSRYFMTGPEGEKAHGWWRFVRIDAPGSLEFDDGFSGADGEPDPSMPTIHCEVTLEAVGDRTRMVVVSQFATVEQMEQLTAMGMVEGLTEAAGQIDGVLAA